jgi:hypothetical protein
LFSARLRCTGMGRDPSPRAIVSVFPASKHSAAAADTRKGDMTVGVVFSAVGQRIIKLPESL